MSDAPMPSAPVLRFEEAADAFGQDEAVIATVTRSEYAKIEVSLVRSKYRQGAHVAVCLWFRDGSHSAWHRDKRRRGAILLPQEIDDVIAGLKEARRAALEVNATIPQRPK